MKRIVLALALLTVSMSSAHAGLLTENFDNVPGLGASGWTQVNNSASPGTGWFQGNSGVFGAFSGAPDSYVAANFLAANSGAIDLWLITPEIDLSTAIDLSFYTRRNDSPLYDRLEVRLSGSGASTTLTDFVTSLVLSEVLDGPDYPIDWAQVNASFAGLGAGATGRLAFRYRVADVLEAGDYIGIDAVNVEARVPEPATLTLLLVALMGIALARRQSRSATG